jgi:hypothetical protein
MQARFWFPKSASRLKAFVYRRALTGGFYFTIGLTMGFLKGGSFVKVKNI